MNFTEESFWILGAATYVLWLLLRGRYWPVLGALVVASLICYGHDNWWLIPLILSYCIVNWLVALWVASSRRPGWAVSVGVGYNLAVLVYWKYTPLLLTTLSSALGSAGVTYNYSVPTDWAIPAGISFYAFTGIAYMVDVYRKTTPPERSFLRYCLYITFFPHLVAGPILRPNEFLDQLQPGRLPVKPDAKLEAIWLIAWGLFKKVVVADRIAIAIDPFFAHVGDASTAGVWSLPFVYLYAFQIYLDFSGYTDIARGIGLLFGFRWPENFNAPYLADSIQEFWRRWHMTLSRFLKDYLYISLGGNRGGRWRTCRNMMITMLLGGLWHGASWSFLVWGGIHGTLLVAHRLWSETPMAKWIVRQNTGLRLAWRWMGIALTFHAVCLAWCFFRISRFEDSLACVRKWIDFDPTLMFVGGAAEMSVWMLLLLYGCIAIAMRHAPRLAIQRADWLPIPVAGGSFNAGVRWGLSLAILVLVFVLSPGVEAPPFIYFQF